MILTILLLVYGYACKLYSDKELVKYSLYKSSGQVVRDLSGNKYHALNGGSLESTSEDVTWTDRGAYFDGSQCISTGKSIVSENAILLSRNFTLVTWLYITNNRGYIYGSEGYLKINYKPNYLVNRYKSEKQQIFVSEGFKSNFYSDKWGMFCLLFTYFPTYGILRMAHNNNLLEETTVLKTWEDSPDYEHNIGKKYNTIQGFMYEFTIYDEVLPPSAFSSDTLFVASSPCDGYPVSLGVCIPEVQDPLMNSENESCVCNGSSCRSGGDCIECECDLNCSTSPPYSCLDFESEFCCPYSFDTVSLVCDNTSCCEGFFWVEESLSCSSSCPSGFFANSYTRKCEECDQMCLECQGTASYCLSCRDTNTNASQGTCVCSEGLIPISFDPLQCCSQTCTHCDRNSTCSQCIPNASLQNGNCLCDSGYFLNSSFDCEKCGSYCLECDEGGCLKCDDKTTLENKQCLCKGEIDQGECLGYFSIFAELKDDRRIELKSEERVVLTKELITLEERVYNRGVDFKIESDDSLTFEIEFEILDVFLEDKYCLDLNFVENIRSLQNNILISSNYSFFYEFSIDRNFSSIEQRTVLGLLFAFLTNFVQMITLNEPTVLWTISRTAQYVSYLPLLDITVSDSFYRFLRTYNTALFFPNLGVKYIERTKSIASLRFQKFGVLNREFEDTNPLRNSARFFALFVGLFCVSVIVCVLSYALPCEFVKRKRDKSRRKILGCLIRLWIMLGLDLLMYSSVTLFSDNTSVLCNLIMNSIIIIGNTCPIVFYLLISKNETQLRSKDEKTMNYLDSLLEGIRLDSNLGIFYEVFMGVRNLVYVYTVCWIWEYPTVFCGIQLFMCCLFFVFMVRCKIFRTGLLMVTNVLSEICLSVVFIGLTIIKESELEEEGVTCMEYIIEGVCISFILFGTFATIVNALLKKCKGKKTGIVNKPPTHVQRFEMQRYDYNSDQLQISHFFEPNVFTLNFTPSVSINN